MGGWVEKAEGWDLIHTCLHTTNWFILLFLCVLFVDTCGGGCNMRTLRWFRLDIPGGSISENVVIVLHVSSLPLFAHVCYCVRILCVSLC